MQVKLQGGPRPPGGPERPLASVRPGGVPRQDPGVRPPKHPAYQTQGKDSQVSALPTAVLGRWYSVNQSSLKSE